VEKISKEAFDRVYNKLKPLLSVDAVEKDSEHPRQFEENGFLMAVVWASKGKSPTPEQFAKAYNLEVT
jgi:hypothetical protein